MISTAHIVFTPFVSGLLMEGLKRRSLSDEVLLCPDDLTLGPIGDVPIGDRILFFSKYLADCPHADDILSYFQGADLFWNTVKNFKGRIYIWFFRFCASEYAGFHEFLFRIRSPEDLYIVDLSKKSLRYESMAVPSRLTMYGDFSPDSLVNMLNTSRRLSPHELEEYLNEWKALISEMSFFRIIRDGRLKSTFLSLYDETLLSHVPYTWVKASKVIREEMVSLSKEVVNVGETFLFLRLHAMQRQNLVELKGETMWHTLNIRRVET